MKGFLLAFGLVMVSVVYSNGVLPKVACSYPGETISDVNDCHGYWYCNANLDPEYHECPPGMDWDAILMQCKSQPVTCAGTGTQPTTATTTVSGSQFDCTIPSEIVPYLYDCESYFICDENLVLAFYYKCDPGYFYDPTYGACNLESKVECVIGLRPSPFPTAIPGAVTPDAAVSDACLMGHPGTLVPDPVDCKYWWKCNSQKYPELFACPSGLNFDHYVPMRCVDISIARCT